MSEATFPLLDGLKEAMDSIPAPRINYAEEDYGFKKRRRYRKGENIKPTQLQARYQQQIRNNMSRNAEVIDKMSKLIAWTWMPGKDRIDCPPLVDLKDPRLVVMHSNDLTMFRTTINKQGLVTYAGPNNVEMSKDFSIRPHFRAGGLCLDSRNEDVFRTALALDKAIELVANSVLEPTSTFSPPQCLSGFPRHYLPLPEWRQPMQSEVLKFLHPDGQQLKCLLSPGGLIVSIVETGDGFRTINLDKNGNLLQVRIPTWVILSEAVYPTNVVQEAQPLANLPRGVYSSIKEVTRLYPFKSLEWLEKRIMEDLTEMVTVSEDVWDMQTRSRVPTMSTWRALPSQLVQNQTSRATRFFLDFRQHLGRMIFSKDALGDDVCRTNAHQVKIEVAVLPQSQAVYLDSRAWYAELVNNESNLALAA